MSILDLNNGFVWFHGEVTDIDDPEKLGRVRVRAIPFYKKIESDQLPWAQCIQPIQSAASNHIGISPTGIEVGSMVIGFFLDGELMQQPMVIGTFAGTDDLPQEAVGTNKVRRVRAPGEPATSYAAEYPYNKSIRTRRGHVIEVDDTEGAERIHIFHREGSYIEMRPDGSVVYKTDANRYDMTVGNMLGYVDGDFRLGITGKARVIVNGDASVMANTVTVAGQSKLILTSPEIEINGSANFDPVDQADNQEPDDMESDQYVMTPAEYATYLEDTDAEERESSGMQEDEPNNDQQEAVSCGNYTSSSPEIVHLSSGADVFPHAITEGLSGGQKVWRSSTFGTLTLTEADIVCNLGGVHENIVKKLFDQFGASKFNINSGYRPGHGGSQHDAGMAVDIQMKADGSLLIGDPTKSLEYATWIRQNCAFDQLALEYQEFGRCWIHASYVRPEVGSNRGQIFTWKLVNGTTTTIARGEMRAIY